MFCKKTILLNNNISIETKIIKIGQLEVIFSKCLESLQIKNTLCLIYNKMKPDVVYFYFLNVNHCFLYFLMWEAVVKHSSL